jgi:AAA domain
VSSAFIFHRLSCNLIYILCRIPYHSLFFSLFIYNLFSSVNPLLPLSSFPALFPVRHLLSLHCSFLLYQCYKGKYTQLLKIWDLVTPHQALKLSARIAKSYNGKSTAYLSRCRERSDLPYTPVTWDPDENFAPISSVCAMDVTDTELSCANMKQYSLSSKFARSLFLSDQHTHLEYPHDVGEEEQMLIKKSSSQIVCGRSGTGKTTVMLHRMCEIDSSSRLEDEDKMPVPQMLVTASLKLADQIRESYREMALAADPTSTFEDLSGLTRLDEISPQGYPLIVTYDRFLRMLDQTLSYPFMAPGSRTVVMDLRLFKDRYYDSMDQAAVRQYKITAPSLYTEIMSVIKGSVDAIKMGGRRALSRETYVGLAQLRKGSHLSAEEREVYYSFFEEYSARLGETPAHYDAADFVSHVYSALAAAPYKGMKMEYVYVDEVQDLSPAQICIFRVRSTCDDDDGILLSALYTMHQNGVALQLSRPIVNLILFLAE